MSDSYKKPLASDQLRFTDEQFIWRFSPNQTDPELLESISVGREPLLQNVLDKVADSATSGATHHVLLYGPRGIGKSHFFSLLHHRLVNDPGLSDAMHIAWLNEVETTTSMAQLLVRIYRSLCKWYPDEYSAKWLDELLDQSAEEIIGVLTRRLVARFEKRRLVILVENLNLLFENLGTEGQHQLRTLLQEHPFACLIATSQQLFKAVTDRSEPFFGFFQQIPLKPLTLPDAEHLLVKIAASRGQADLVQFLNTPDGRGRVRAIHDLAGGNHRVYVVLSGFVTRESLDQLVVPFQKMADDLTPYYRERLCWISPLQRQIVELLCREYGTVNPKEIARRLLVDQRSIGKQVRVLEELGYLTSTRRGRETFYELSEPLMRLAYEVKDQSLLQMLIEFLRVWYRPDEIQTLRTAGLNQISLAYVDAAWERSQTTPDPRLKLLQQELEKAQAEGRSHELATLWQEKAAASNTAGDWFSAGFCFETINQKYANALDCYDRAIELAPKFAHPRFNRSEAIFAMHRWEDGFRSIGDAFAQSRLYYLGDTASMFSLIFRSSEDDARLQSRIRTLVDLYQFAAAEHGFRTPEESAERRRFGKRNAADRIAESNEYETAQRSVRPTVNPLSHLGDGLVRSLAKIDAGRITPAVLESYVAAVEQRVADLSEFNIPLRLFRYGIRYLISGKESEFVELIQPERRILRQALDLPEES
ncbi:MAG: AAA family ATPase [Fuerstiella sp.]